MRSLLSSSRGTGSWGASPRRRMWVMVSMADAVALFMLATLVAFSALSRSMSLVKVPATTPPTKKSPPSRSALRLWAHGAMPVAAGAASTAVCVAYVPSASTAGRLTTVTSCTAACALATSALPPSADMKGAGPRACLMTSTAASTSSTVQLYSPNSHRAVEHTLEDLMVEKVSRRRSKIEGRSFALVSTISRTKKMTSSALAVLASPRKSISRCTTLLATSGNLSAQLWMACTSICRYSPPFSKSLFCVFTTSFFRTMTTSSMLREVMRSMEMSSVFLRMSMFGLVRARKISINMSCMTSRCLFLSSCRRSSTMSLTLLSLCETSSWQ
mmetsp:Transcript_5376/g.14489  ORF Transcript_5376/g.14489 Transcript_5376/m.14489 type:complete len:329 (+) Transcript_5376:1408-2394(+)